METKRGKLISQCTGHELKATRRYDIDWMRVIAVLLLIPFHSMHIFILQPYSVVYIKNDTGIAAFEKITQFIHTFHMPLLFVLAGASVYFSLQSRSQRQFIKERLQKLFIPLLSGILLVIPPMTYIYRISQGDDLSLLNHYIKFFSENPGDFSGLTGAFSPAHLWFIMFLFVFSIAGLPVFTFHQEAASITIKIRRILTKRFLLLLYTVPVALAGAVNLLDDKNPLVYFLIFLLGYLLMTNEAYQQAINRDKLGYFLIGVIFQIILLCYPNYFKEWSLIWILYEMMSVVNRLVWVFAMIGFGNKYLNHPSKALSYLSKASFPVYILHLPINTMVGYFIVNMKLAIYPKFILIVVLTTVISYALYEVIRRIPPICFLFGIKTPEKPICNNKNILDKSHPQDL